MTGSRTPLLLAAATLATLAVQPAFAAGAEGLLPANLSPWGMFQNADIVVKTVMVGLACASLATWTVWLAKTIELRRETNLAHSRLEMLESDTSLRQVERDSADARDAVAQLIHTAVRETELSHGIFDDGFKERIALRLERVEGAMARRIARGTGIVATIGSTSPFIGIAETKTTNLAVVAPGIAEALLATALGLVAAIPAVMIYNALVRSITGYRALLGDASAQVMLLISRDHSRRGMPLARAAE